MGLFNDKSASHECLMPSTLVGDAQEPFISKLTFRQFNMCISGTCAAISCISIFILMARHATHFSKPNEQTKILKICTLIPLESVLNFITIVEPNSFVYLEPWLNVFQAWALGSFFLLLCEFVSPSPQFRDVFFAALEVPRRRRSKGSAMGGLEWYRKKWFSIFQYVLVAIGVAIATAITQAAHVYCLESNKAYFAHLWLTVVIDISIVVALIALLAFYNALKHDLKHHKPLAKFVAFKIIILLTFLQKILFQILRGTSVLKESATMTWADVNIGLQTMIVCIEMVPISLYFHYAYDAGSYNLANPRPLAVSEVSNTGRPSDLEGNSGYNVQLMSPGQTRQPHHQGIYYGGPLGLKAWATVPDPREIIRAIRFAFAMRSEAAKLNRNYISGHAPPTYSGRN